MRTLNLLPIFLASFIFGACSHKHNTLFEQVNTGHTGIDFINVVTENDSINPIRMEFLYNGGGVAVGDFNNDSLQDLYFTASTTSNKLYLNRGDFAFTDISGKAHVTGDGRWSNGATVVDINNDGWQDIYVSTSIRPVRSGRNNLLYMNQGLDKNGIPVFREMAAEYGLADTSYSVQAVFFDYDLDGDLDMYLVTTKPTSRNTYTFGNRKDSSRTDYDRLYRNDYDEHLKHPFFTEVGEAAGIHEKGYGLGVSVGDLNKDGWPDLYVTNDFITSDHLYLNNRNGTFTNRVKESFRHTSQNAMGNDMADVNNDGWPDIVAVDMNPEDNFRKQKNMGSANYGKYRNMADFGYSLQFVRNTLQINQGLTAEPGDSMVPLFSDISYYAGVAETDWSWSPSLADFDNDGLRDLLITNGYPKDVTDHDYISYRNDKGYIVEEKKLLEQIPEIRIPNYAFRNTTDLRFQNVTATWGLDNLSYSAGAAYADLDNDGDLDYVVSNINSVAAVYRNTNEPGKTAGANYLRIRFAGDALNRDGFGARALVYFAGQPHLYEHYPARGYLSSMEPFGHFGLGAAAYADSILISWPGGFVQRMGQTAANQVINVRRGDASPEQGVPSSPSPLLVSITGQAGFDLIQDEYDFIDFDYQRLLPHKLSEFGPALASGDVDGNGLDDLFVAGPKGRSGIFLLQQTTGSFLQQPLQQVAHPSEKPWEETGVLLLDLDNDQDLDLYMCSGSVEFKKSDTAYRDRIFVNDGHANFRELRDALPENLSSKQVLKAADFDRDGDVDLFIGSRSIPNEYPYPASGFLYRNDSKDGVIRFTDVTATLCPGLRNLGLISDASWTDFNGDGTMDLIVCGEFMPVTFFRNLNGRFHRVDAGVEGQNGMFNSITATDLNNDGRMDYVLGNLGLNSFYRGSEKSPLMIYANDFDKNGSIDAIPFVYLKDQQGRPDQFPAFTRDDLFKQMPRTKAQFPTYKEFASANLSRMLTDAERDSALKVTAGYFYSAILLNKGNGRFELEPLPYQAQWSPVYGVLAEDLDQDGNIDLLLNTNDLGTEVNTGQYDALYGLVLKGDGKGGFRPMTLQASGLLVPSNGKAVIRFGYGDQFSMAVSQNKDRLLLYQPKRSGGLIRLKAGECDADIALRNGATRRLELNAGSTFLSQDARIIVLNKSIRSVRIRHVNGTTRTIQNIEAD